ncbi:hypothetical protein BUL40_04280 [Croceivirga radicis]|uniref:STAS/SEC14 domain-containing protein n=1 Tax=Croceivirga radicis TaxID=1929488 RepID=A0A1V6LUK6_9FLAO|nr:hypothetical protein [Croceivirga radicis]OQD43829.1 hypothetical protein BUL40_04280 [Croceivirga radicis]
MLSIKQSPYYHRAFQELNYAHGDYYLFEHFIIAEIKEDIIFNWNEHAKHVVAEISDLYENNGKDLVYISNRVNNYSVVPTDWVHFFKYQYNLKGYAVVTSKKGKAWYNSLLEKMFVRNQMQTFMDLHEAIEWAESLYQAKKALRSAV